MQQNLFHPVYIRLEQEFKELSYSIALDKKNLAIFSIKIADLILRTVSECENIARAICQKEKIKFKDKSGKIRKLVYFYEYIEELDKIFGLNQWLVNLKYANSSEDIFDWKNMPFKKDRKTKIGKKEFEDWCWYDAYNSIKHNRVKYFKKANLENLIFALEALFLLNIIYNDKIFYQEHCVDYGEILQEIENFSDVFGIDVAVKTDKYEKVFVEDDNSFFYPIGFMKIAKDYSVYLVEHDVLLKTSADSCKDLVAKLDSCAVYLKEDGSTIPAFEQKKVEDNKTKCAVVARVNRICNR